MKEEARFQIRGEVTGLLDETYKDSVRVALVLRVAISQDKNAWFKVAVWGEELARIARACKGRYVLVIGRMNGGMSQSGYYNAYMSADAILVEPGSKRSYGAADSAPAACEPPPPQKQPQQLQTFSSKEVLGDEMAEEDIPF